MKVTDSKANLNLLKNSIFLLIKLSLTLFISLYCSRIVLQELGVVDFGIYNVVGGVVALLSFLTGAMSSSTQRFLSYEIGRDNNKVRQIFSMSINIYMLIALLTILISQTLGVWFVNFKLNVSPERIESAYWVFQASTLSFIFALFTAPYDAILIAYEKIKIYSFIGVVTILIRLALILSLSVVPGDKLVSYSIIMIIVSFCTLLLPLICARLMLRNSKYILTWDVDLFWQLVGYTGWSLFGNLSAVGFNQGITILLNLFFGPTVNAAKGISTQVNAALLGFANNINTAINPQIIKSFSSDEKERMIDLVFNGSKYSFLFLSLMAVPILVNTEELLTIWLGEVPDYSVDFTILVIIDSLVCGFSGTLMTSIQATGKIKYYQLIIGGVLLMNIPLSYCLLKINSEPLIPFLVTITLSFIAFNLRLIFVKIYFDISVWLYYKNVVLRATSSFILSILTVIWLKQMLSMATGELFIITFISILTSLIYIWLISLTKEEKFFLKQVIFKLLK